MGKHYTVMIKAKEVAVEPHILSQRLAPLLGASVEEVENALLDSPLILQKALSYGEALELQRELSRRKIPSMIGKGIGEGREFLLPTRPPEAISEDGGRSRADVPLSGVSSGSEDNRAQVAKDYAGADEAEEPTGAWAELFPDLLENESTKGQSSIGEQAAGEVSRDSGADFAFAASSGNRSGTVREVYDRISAPQLMSTEAELDLFLEDYSSDDDQTTGPFASSLDGRDQSNEKVTKFDGSRLQEAFVGTEETRPPYQPKGFDRRPEHVPLLAAMLAVLAPGAGHIFNGQNARGQGLAVKGLLLWPWVQSVRESLDYAEKVRTYYAPRPEPGALRRAIVYGLRWWGFMLVVFAISFWSLFSLIEYREAERERGWRLQFQEVVFFGNDVVEDAILDAREAAENAEIPEEGKEEDPRFSMDKSERARRLYIIGYHYCLAGEYSMCEAAMRRVTTLVRDNRDAFRLQAWAGIQANDPRDTSKMPEVAPVPSLEAFELELSLAGENLEEASEDDLWDDGARLRDGEFEHDGQSEDGENR